MKTAVGVLTVASAASVQVASRAQASLNSMDVDIQVHGFVEMYEEMQEADVEIAFDHDFDLENVELYSGEIANVDAILNSLSTNDNDVVFVELDDEFEDIFISETNHVTGNTKVSHHYTGQQGKDSTLKTTAPIKSSLGKDHNGAPVAAAAPVVTTSLTSAPQDNMTESTVGERVDRTARAGARGVRRGAVYVKDQTKKGWNHVSNTKAGKATINGVKKGASATANASKKGWNSYKNTRFGAATVRGAKKVGKSVSSTATKVKNTAFGKSVAKGFKWVARKTSDGWQWVKVTVNDYSRELTPEEKARLEKQKAFDADTQRNRTEQVVPPKKNYPEGKHYPVSGSKYYIDGNEKDGFFDATGTYFPLYPTEEIIAERAASFKNGSSANDTAIEIQEEETPEDQDDPYVDPYVLSSSPLSGAKSTSTAAPKAAAVAKKPAGKGAKNARI